MCPYCNSLLSWTLPCCLCYHYTVQTSDKVLIRKCPTSCPGLTISLAKDTMRATCARIVLSMQEKASTLWV